MPALRLALSAAALAACADALYSKDSPVQLMDGAALKKRMKNDTPFMAEFFASWCGHCKQLAPEYEKAAKATKGIVDFVAVEDQAAMGEYGVQGFPTLKWIVPGSSPVEYSAGRTAKDFVEFAMKQIAQTVSKRLGQKVNAGSAGGGGGSSGGDSSSDGGDTIVLTDGEFDSTVMEDEKNVWFIKFYAPWCGHCKAMAGDWDSLATQFKGKVKVAKVDATVETVSAGKFGVQGFPSIKLLPAGKKTIGGAVDYEGGRDIASMAKFAEKYFSMTLEPEQLLTQEMFDETCKEQNNLCVIAFLPHILETTAADRNKYLEDYKLSARAAGGVPASFFWSEGGSQFEFEEKLNLGFGWPAVVAISMKKSIFVIHRGSFTQTSLRQFITGLSAPKHLNTLPKELPPLVKQKKWDGQDAPKEEEEEEEAPMKEEDAAPKGEEL